jgi:spore maturation protein CgeB
MQDNEFVKIIYCGLENDSYDPKRGKSFEYKAFYEGLKRYPGAEVLNFPFDRILEVGKATWNRELVEKVSREKPDLVFVFMFSDELAMQALEELKKITATVAWFADDSWRFYNYSRRYARHFTWAITTYSWMPDEYKKIGQPNIIRSQWGVDAAAFKPVGNVGGPDTAFVGGWSRPRAKILRELQARGVEVSAYGAGWPGGKVTDEKMLEIFSGAKINLGLNPPPGFLNKNSLGRLLFRHSVNTIVPDLHFIQNSETFFRRGIPQIKARHFEIPACGGLMMTSMADDLDTYFRPGEEIVIYKDLDDFAKKINYYLSHDDERKRIAKAGYERTLRDHTYQKRFEEIFRKVGLGNNK